MQTHNIGIIMNGVTGRMGTNQHLLRSIKAIRDEGGHFAFARTNASGPIRFWSGATPTNSKLLAKRAGVERWTTEP